MNAPTHFAASTVIAFGLLQLLKSRGPVTRLRLAGGAGLGMGMAAAVHLVFDITPHYAWAYYLGRHFWWEWGWVITESLFSLMVVLPCLYWASPYRLLICLVMVAGIYPDIEKVLKLNYYLMADEVIFHTHSHMGSCNDYGFWKPGLVGAELVLVGALMVLAYRWSPRRRAAAHKTPDPTA